MRFAQRGIKTLFLTNTFSGRIVVEQPAFGPSPIIFAPVHRMNSPKRFARTLLLLLPFFVLCASLLPFSGASAQTTVPPKPDDNGCWSTWSCTGRWTTIWLVVPVYVETCTSTVYCER